LLEPFPMSPVVDHGKGTVCSSGGIISDRLWTRHTLLVSLALIQ